MARRQIPRVKEMRILSELRTVELTRNMNTVDSIYNDLLKLGV